jgi:hypothetical protein
VTITVCVLVAEGIVLAADSRQVVVSAAGKMRVDSDNADKIFQLGPRLAASVCGQGTFYASGHESPWNVGWLLRAAAARLPQDCSVAEAAAALHRRVADVPRRFGHPHDVSLRGFQAGGAGFDQAAGVAAVAAAARGPGQVAAGGGLSGEAPAGRDPRPGCQRSMKR